MNLGKDSHDRNPLKATEGRDREMLCNSSDYGTTTDPVVSPRTSRTGGFESDFVTQRTRLSAPRQGLSSADVASAVNARDFLQNSRGNILERRGERGSQFCTCGPPILDQSDEEAPPNPASGSSHAGCDVVQRQTKLETYIEFHRYEVQRNKTVKYIVYFDEFDESWEHYLVSARKERNRLRTRELFRELPFSPARVQFTLPPPSPSDQQLWDQLSGSHGEWTNSDDVRTTTRTHKIVELSKCNERECPRPYHYHGRNSDRNKNKSSLSGAEKRIKEKKKAQSEKKEWEQYILDGGTELCKTTKMVDVSTDCKCDNHYHPLGGKFADETVAEYGMLLRVREEEVDKHMNDITRSLAESMEAEKGVEDAFRETLRERAFEQVTTYYMRICEAEGRKEGMAAHDILHTRYAEEFKIHLEARYNTLLQREGLEFDPASIAAYDQHAANRDVDGGAAPNAAAPNDPDDDDSSSDDSTMSDGDSGESSDSDDDENNDNGGDGGNPNAPPNPPAAPENDNADGGADQGAGDNNGDQNENNGGDDNANGQEAVLEQPEADGNNPEPGVPHEEIEAALPRRAVAAVRANRGIVHEVRRRVDTVGGLAMRDRRFVRCLGGNEIPQFESEGEVVLAWRTFPCLIRDFNFTLTNTLNQFVIRVRQLIGSDLSDRNILHNYKSVRKPVMVHLCEHLVATSPRKITTLDALLSIQSSFMTRASNFTKNVSLLRDSFAYYCYLLVMTHLGTIKDHESFARITAEKLDPGYFEYPDGEGTTYKGPRGILVPAKDRADVDCELSRLCEYTMHGAWYDYETGFFKFKTMGTVVKSNDTMSVCGLHRDPQTQTVLYNANIALSGLTRFCGVKDPNTFYRNKVMLDYLFPASYQFLKDYNISSYAFTQEETRPVYTDLLARDYVRLAENYRDILRGIATHAGQHLLYPALQQEEVVRMYTEDVGGPKMSNRLEILDRLFERDELLANGLTLNIKDELTKYLKAARLTAALTGINWYAAQPHLIAALKDSMASTTRCVNGDVTVVSYVDAHEDARNEMLQYARVGGAAAGLYWQHTNVLYPLKDLFKDHHEISEVSRQRLTIVVRKCLDFLDAHWVRGRCVTASLSHGDDVWMVRKDQDGVVEFIELDISSCDASHTTGLFEFIDTLVSLTNAGRGYNHNAIAQTSLPYILYNPENRAEYITFNPKGLVLPSGSVLTTALNTLASQWICFAFACRGNESLNYTGYKTTIKRSTDIRDTSFLGSFFYLDENDVVHVASDPAILLRSFGSLKRSSVDAFPRQQRQHPLYRQITRNIQDRDTAIVWFNTYQRVVAMAGEGDALYLKCLRRAFDVELDEPVIDAAALNPLDLALVSRVSQPECSVIMGATDPLASYLMFCAQLRDLRVGVYVSSVFFSACMHNKYGENVVYH